MSFELDRGVHGVLGGWVGTQNSKLRTQNWGGWAGQLALYDIAAGNDALSAVFPDFEEPLFGELQQGS